MSKGKRYTQQFKEEAVKQIVERGYSVAEVAERLGICTKTPYHWKASMHGSSHQIKFSDDQAEIARLKAELMRVTEERDISKRPQSTLQASPSKVRVHPSAPRRICSGQHVPRAKAAPQWLLCLVAPTAF